MVPINASGNLGDVNRVLSELAVLGAALAAASCSPGGTTVNHPSTPNTSTPKPAAASAHVGATLTLNGLNSEKLQITVVKLTDPAPPTNQFEAPPAGTREIALEVRYKNVGSVTYNQSILTDITVVDQGSHDFSVDLAYETSAGPGFPSDNVDIAPGETEDGFVPVQVETASVITEVKVGLDEGFGPDTGEWLVP